MRVNSITPSYFNSRNNFSPNFKAQVMIIPSCADSGQPQRDRVTLQKQIEDYKSKLEKAYPDDDNVVIVLQPDGFDCPSNKTYYNSIKEFVGYKDAERARIDILKIQDGLDPEDKLEPHIVRALQHKDPEMMKRLAQNKVSNMASEARSEYLKPTIDSDIVQWMDNTIALMEYTITAPEKVEQKKETPIKPPLWWRILMGDPGSPI